MSLTSEVGHVPAPPSPRIDHSGHASQTLYNSESGSSFSDDDACHDHDHLSHTTGTPPVSSHELVLGGQNADQHSPIMHHPSQGPAHSNRLGINFSGIVRVGKRVQVKNACTNCQKACKKCDDARPCTRCVRYNLADSCVNSMRKERVKGLKRGPYRKREEQGFMGTLDRASMPPGLPDSVSPYQREALYSSAFSHPPIYPHPSPWSAYSSAAMLQQQRYQQMLAHAAQAHAPANDSGSTKLPSISELQLSLQQRQTSYRAQPPFPYTIPNAINSQFDSMGTAAKGYGPNAAPFGMHRPTTPEYYKMGGPSQENVWGGNYSQHLQPPQRSYSRRASTEQPPSSLSLPPLKTLQPPKTNADLDYSVRPLHDQSRISVSMEQLKSSSSKLDELSELCSVLGPGN